MKSHDITIVFIIAEIIDPYIPPEGDGKHSLLQKEVSDPFSLDKFYLEIKR